MQSQKFHHYSSYPQSGAAQAPAQEQTGKVGLWIDHRKAVIVTLTDTDKGYEIKHVESHLRSDARPAAGWPAHSGEVYTSSTRDQQDRRFTGHLEKYYDEVISAFHDAQVILIFGPGEAKGELKKRIERKGPKGPAVTVETADEMTEPQIAAKVREHFQK